MPNPLDLGRQVYRGYKGDGEPHWARVTICAIIAFCISLKSDGLDRDALSVIGVIVSVLAGFSFTALFSSHSHSTKDLPDAKSESDRADLKSLRNLFENFENRSRYFLIISVLCLLFVFLLSVSVEFHIFRKFLSLQIILKIVKIINIIWHVSSIIIKFFCLLLFFEILYTFYRMAETIFSILNKRRKYLEVER